MKQSKVYPYLKALLEALIEASPGVVKAPAKFISVLDEQLKNKSKEEVEQLEQEIRSISKNDLETMIKEAGEKVDYRFDKVDEALKEIMEFLKLKFEKELQFLLQSKIDSPFLPGPKILVMFSMPFVDTNGNPLPKLDFESEREEILNYLKESGIGFQIKFAPATTQNLQRCILAKEFDILHFSGHGDEDYLIFEDNLARAHKLDQDQLYRLIQNSSSPPKLVFLSACYSESVVQRFIKAGIKHVIVIDRKKPVLDWSAKIFTRNFYLALAMSKTVEEAYQAGLTAVNTDPILGQKAKTEERKFQLLPKNVSHEEKLFTTLPKGDVEDISDKLPPSNIPEQIAPFIGREELMHGVIATLFNNRFVSLIGFGGIGKTATAREIARWYRQRYHFSSGIYIIDLDAVESVELMRRRISDAIKLGAVEKDEDLAEALALGKYLFILDNLEAVLIKNRLEVRRLLKILLEKAPGVKLLVTSRESVGGQIGETRIDVPRLSKVEAKDLLIALAEKVCNIDQLKRSKSFNKLLELLDCYPLAMVLTAPQLQNINIEDLVEKLEKAWEDVFSDPSLTEEEKTKQSSVFASLGLSYQQLKEIDKERVGVKLFPLLSLFPAGIRREALTEIFGKWEKDGMEKLRRISLVEHRNDWYYLPVPIRRYAQILLPEDALSQYAPTALRYYYRLTAALSSRLGEELSIFTERALSQELPNIYTFMDWGTEREELSQEPGIRCYTAGIASTLNFYYQFSGQYQEGIKRANQGIQAAKRIRDINGEANCLQALGDLCLRMDDLDGAQKNYDDALPKYREIGARLGEANCISSQAKLSGLSGNLKQSFQLFEMAMNLYSEMNDLYS